MQLILKSKVSLFFYLRNCSLTIWKLNDAIQMYDRAIEIDSIYSHLFNNKGKVSLL